MRLAVHKRRSGLRRGLMVSFASMVVSAASTPGRAQGVAPAAVQDREEALRAFQSGTKAFKEGAFLRAAEDFEAAYAHRPHPDALYNAAVAWQRANVFDRAANDFVQYLRESSADASDRDKATAALNELRGTLGRFAIESPGAEHVRVDHKPIAGGDVYVTPGTHSIEASWGAREVSVTRSVAAGEEIRVRLEGGGAPGAAPTAAAGPLPPTPAAHRGWSPAVVYVGIGFTVASTAAMIASAIDTLNARASFNANPTQGAYDEGIAKQNRTNALFYASVGLAALTATAAIWLVDWHGSSGHGRVGVAANSLRAQWQFP